MSIRVPATSANMGPGFDALGAALSMYCEVGVVGDGATPDGAQEANDTHPAQVAFVRAGGGGRVWVRNHVPMGRGMGFSGAARIGGALAAERQREGRFVPRSPSALALCTELEGHADNVAPALHGGVVVASEGHVVHIPVVIDAAWVMWVPESTTSTSESRRKIGASVPLADAVFNIARTAMLVAALAGGDTTGLREATRDRIHQDIRFAASPASAAALEAGLAAGAWCGWLSGSGPTVALLCEPADAARLAESLPTGGRSLILSLDQAGAVEV
jgi:homoserine kinase